MPPIDKFSIANTQPFTEQVTINCHGRVNVFIGPNATGKSTLIRYIRGLQHECPCVTVPAVRIGFPKSQDETGHSHLIRQSHDVQDVSEALHDDPALFDSRKLHAAKVLMENRLLTDAESRSVGAKYYEALSIAHDCARKICHELLSEEPPKDYGWKRSFSLNVRATETDGTQVTRNRTMGEATQHYPWMGYSVSHAIPYDYNRRGPYNQVFRGDLSDGTQGTISWIEFFVLKMAEHYEFSVGWRARPAILLIDEIENHLHPNWQRRVIPTLLDSFAGLQVFATTHSPFVVAGLQPGQVHQLFRDDELVVRAALPNGEAIVGWTVDEILRGLMEVPDPTDEKTAMLARELRELRKQEPKDSDEEEEERKRRIEELSQSVDRSLEAGGIGAADLALFEEQFKAALTEYRESNGQDIE